MFKISFLWMMSLLALGCTHDTSTVVFLPGSQDAGLAPTADAGNDPDVVRPGQDAGGNVDPTTTPDASADASPDVGQTDAGAPDVVAAVCDPTKCPHVANGAPICADNVCDYSCKAGSDKMAGGCYLWDDVGTCTQNGDCLHNICNLYTNTCAVSTCSVAQACPTSHPYCVMGYCSSQMP